MLGSLVEKEPVMNNGQEVIVAECPSPRPLQVYPGVVIVMLQWLVRFGIPAVFTTPEAMMIAMLGGLLGGVAVVVWWAFFSRTPRIERWGGVMLLLVALLATSRVVHLSIATGEMGMMFFFYGIPVFCLAFVISAVVGSRLPVVPRHVTMVATLLLTGVAWTLVRSDGLNGNGGAIFNWRWAETPEQRLLARVGDESMMLPSVTGAVATGAGWSGFRGPNRDGIIHGVKINTDWSASPPIELWRRPVGPGCSSFAVRGDLCYTQEQRGNDEIVACYRVSTGRPVWRHRDKARFWDSHAGAGPRATPTLNGGRVYTFGATGILNALNADNGAVFWSRNAASDTRVAIPTWGFASSPLVVGDTVIVAVAGTLAAYDLADGKARWSGPVGGKSYSSPQHLTIDGISQVLLMRGHRLTSVAPDNGKILWEYPLPPAESIVQPALTADGDLFISYGDPMVGLRRLAVTRGPGGWTVKERWSSTRMNPNFNDFVVHKGHAFGYLGPSLVCLDVSDGKRNWRDGRFGGQLILLADQDLLLVLTEKGELALVAATPDKFTELARFPAIKGKTWNHPALAGNILLVRNSQEMAAFRLSRFGD